MPTKDELTEQNERLAGEVEELKSKLEAVEQLNIDHKQAITELKRQLDERDG